MDSIKNLTNFIENLKGNPKLSLFDEASTKQTVILPILHHLGWNIFEQDEVTPEFSVGSGRVDYSLRLNHSNEFFIEVKKPGEDLEIHQEQLLNYSFQQGVELAALTNGVTWWFYLPTQKGDWKTRKFYTIDVIQQETNDAASKFLNLLSKDNVQSGKSVQHAKSIYEGQQKKKAVEETLPEAWNEIVIEKDVSLLDLLAKTTEKICGYRPDPHDVKKFLENNKNILISPEEEVEEKSSLSKHPQSVATTRTSATGRFSSERKLAEWYFDNKKNHHLRIWQSW